MTVGWPAPIVEWAPGAAPLSTNPTWVDISTAVKAVNIKRGRSNELAKFSAGTCNVTLSDPAASFSSASSTKALIASPMRVRVGLGSECFRITAVGTYLLSADKAALDITGDIDVRWDGALTDWTTATDQSLLAKWNSFGVNQRSWRFYVTSAGVPTFTWSTNGTAMLTASCTAAVTTVVDNAERVRLRVTMDVNDGGGNRVIKFWYATRYLNDPLHTATEWTQLGTTVTTAGTTSIHSGSGDLTVGALVSSIVGLLGGVGDHYGVAVLSGIAGTTVAALDVTDPEQVTFGAAVTTGVDPYGNTYTRTGGTDGSFVPGYYNRFRGSVTALNPDWSVRGSQVVTMEAVDPFRQLAYTQVGSAWAATVTRLAEGAPVGWWRLSEAATEDVAVDSSTANRPALYFGTHSSTTSLVATDSNAAASWVASTSTEGAEVTGVRLPGTASSSGLLGDNAGATIALSVKPGATTQAMPIVTLSGSAGVPAMALWRTRSKAVALSVAHASTIRSLLLANSSADATFPSGSAITATDLDLRVDIALARATGASQTLMHRGGNALKEGYRMEVTPAGKVRLAWRTSTTPTSTGAKTADSTGTVTAGKRQRLRATLDVDNGAAGYTARFYKSTTFTANLYASTAWTAIGASTVSGVTSVRAATGPLVVGRRASTAVDRQQTYAQLLAASMSPTIGSSPTTSAGAALIIDSTFWSTSSTKGRDHVDSGSTWGLTGGAKVQSSGSGGACSLLMTGPVLSSGVTRHIAVALSSTGAATIAVDGVVKATRTKPAWLGTRATWIGRGAADWAGHAPGGLFTTTRGLGADSWVGAMDEITVWQDDLSSTSLSDLGNVASTSAWYGDVAGTRINRVLDLVNWPASLSDVPDEGAVELAAIGQSFGSGDALASVTETGSVEGGRLFCDAAGKVRWQARHWGLSSTAGAQVQATLNDVSTSTGTIGFRALNPVWDDSDVVTSVTVSRTGGSTYTVTSTAAEDRYGPRAVSGKSLPLAEDDVAETLATDMLSASTAPLLRINGASIPVGQDQRVGVARRVMPLDVGDLVSLTVSPSSALTISDYRTWIEGVDDQWKVGESLVVNLALGSRTGTAVAWQTPLILDSTSDGIVGTNRAG